MTVSRVVTASNSSKRSASPAPVPSPSSTESAPPAAVAAASHSPAAEPRRKLRTACVHGQKPGVPSESQQAPCTTSRSPCSRASSTAQRTKDVLPMPASPVTSTSPP